jgi:hypothetical protein
MDVSKFITKPTEGGGNAGSAKAKAELSGSDVLVTLNFENYEPSRRPIIYGELILRRQ